MPRDKEVETGVSVLEAEGKLRPLILERLSKPELLECLDAQLLFLSGHYDIAPISQKDISF